MLRKSEKILKLQLNIRNNARLFAGVPDAIKQVVKGHYSVVLAGGSIRSSLEKQPANDYDLFFVDAAAVEEQIMQRMQRTCEYLVKRGYRVVFACPENKLITLKAGSVKVQLINTQRYVSIANLLESFDFNICQFATDNFLDLYTTPSAVYSVTKSKYMKIVEITYPTASINRFAKYKSYGYKISEIQLTKLVEQITNFLTDFVSAEYDYNHPKLKGIMRLYID